MRYNLIKEIKLEGFIKSEFYDSLTFNTRQRNVQYDNFFQFRCRKAAIKIGVNIIFPFFVIFSFDKSKFLIGFELKTEF